MSVNTNEPCNYSKNVFFFIFVVALILHIEVWEFRVVEENKPIY